MKAIQVPEKSCPSRNVRFADAGRHPLEDPEDREQQQERRRRTRSSAPRQRRDRTLCDDAVPLDALLARLRERRADRPPISACEDEDGRPSHQVSQVPDDRADHRGEHRLLASRGPCR